MREYAVTITVDVEAEDATAAAEDARHIIRTYGTSLLAKVTQFDEDTGTPSEDPADYAEIEI